MDVISSVFQIIMALFGLYQEEQLTIQQCEQMWDKGYVVYPVDREELDRLKRCDDIMSN